PDRGTHLSRAMEAARAWMIDGSDRSRAQRAAGAAFLIRVASAALLYVSQVLFARWMGSFEFGVYVYVWTWVLLLGGLVDLGIATGSQRFIPEYTGTDRLEMLRGFLTGSRWLVLAMATAWAALAALGVRLFSAQLQAYEIMPLYIACAGLPLFTLGRLQDGIARSYDWINLALMPPYVIRSLLLIVAMGAAYWLKLPTDAATAMLAAIATTYVTVIGQTLVMNARLKRKVAPGPRAYAAGTWLAASLPIFMVEGFYLLLTHADVLLLRAFRSPDEVAVYYAAAKTLALVAFVSFSVSAATAHKFSEYHVAGNKAALSAFLSDSIKWTFWPSLAATIVILALGKPFLSLFGPRFLDGYVLMFILAVGPLARATVGPVERLLNMVGEQRACAVVYASAFGVNIALCLLLIPRFGVAGAAFAISGAMILEAALLYGVAKRRLGLHGFIWRPKSAAEAAAK
ncbi:MAG TPA: lipopolysaccharide biosynthesis protein, partial [Xanthobacteraceae bacterium]|nr:lipopolysaccharide biosynthesis protein [Xanthobacteraceae bacterium]